MTFERLRVADWVALLAAFALLLVMAMDWYSTTQGEEARRIERLAVPKGAVGGEVAREVRRQARQIAEGDEQNAWQADGAIDRLILVALLATAGLALAAAFLRAAGRSFEPPWTPSALAAVAAAAAGLLVAYRIVQEPGSDAATTIKVGGPLALVALGVLALGAIRGLRAEEAGAAFAEPLEKPPATPQEPRSEAP
jgi:drug/metabolite transporter (DMT)-like permease